MICNYLLGVKYLFLQCNIERNQDKDVLVQHVERAHQADILCLYQKNEIFCAIEVYNQKQE